MRVSSDPRIMKSALVRQISAQSSSSRTRASVETGGALSPKVARGGLETDPMAVGAVVDALLHGMDRGVVGLAMYPPKTLVS